MIKNVIFDMGNVLLRWNPIQSCLRHCDSKERAERLRDFIFYSPDWPSCTDSGKMHTDEYLRFLLGKAQEDDKPYIRAILSDYWLDSVYPMPGMEELTEELLAAGYQLFLLSNIGYDFYRMSYKIVQLPRFRGVMLSCEEKLMKPSPELFRRLCSRYALSPEECLFVDDVEKNVLGALFAELHGVVFDGTPACVRKAILECNA